MGLELMMNPQEIEACIIDVYHILKTVKLDEEQAQARYDALDSLICNYNDKLAPGMMIKEIIENDIVHFFKKYPTIEEVEKVFIEKFQISGAVTRIMKSRDEKRYSWLIIQEINGNQIEIEPEDNKDFDAHYFAFIDCFQKMCSLLTNEQKNQLAW